MVGLIWYVVFSLVILGVLTWFGAPDVIVGAYVLIAGVGLVMAGRDLLRVRARVGLAQDIMGFADRETARMARQRAAVRAQPWFEEVVAAQNAAIGRGASLTGLFSTSNPYWSLSLASLLRYGLTTDHEIEAIAYHARSSPPESWRNDYMLFDLKAAGYTTEEALIRVGLYKSNQGRFEGPDS